MAIKFARARRLAYALSALGIAASALASPADATIITKSMTLSSCAGGTARNCTDTDYLSTTPAYATTNFIGGNFLGADPSLFTFTTAFNNWAAANGGNWTLVDGGTLDLSLKVTLGLGASSAGGGIDPIIISLSNYRQASSGPSLSELVWTQGLVANYAPTQGNLSAPIASLDTYSLSAGSAGSAGAFLGTCAPIVTQAPGPNNKAPATIGPSPSNTGYCDPIYPFQAGSKYNGLVLNGVRLSTDFFYDAPQGAWPSNAFRGIALLSTVTQNTDAAGLLTNQTLTVYQGVSYGFTLSATPTATGKRRGTYSEAFDVDDVPEPSTAALIVAGLLSLFGLGRMRRRART